MTEDPPGGAIPDSDVREPGSRAGVGGDWHTLYVVPTPIGNLEDLSLRALRVLRQVSVILAEDTRHTRRLLRHFEIATPMRAYHQYNKRTALAPVLALLREGDVALVSDAGTPSVSDPGFELISEAVRCGASVDVLPGPSAVMTAVVGAALPAPGFLFLGFPGRKSGERRRQLEQVLDLPYTLVFYEAPHRLVDFLHDALTVLGDRQVVVARELTKVHQEYVRGPITDVLAQFDSTAPRGEITVLLSGRVRQPEDEDASAAPILEEVRRRARAGEDRRTVFADLVGKRGARRADVYRAWMEARDEADTPGDGEAP